MRENILSLRMQNSEAASIYKSMIWEYDIFVPTVQMRQNYCQYTGGTMASYRDVLI